MTLQLNHLKEYANEENRIFSYYEGLNMTYKDLLRAIQVLRCEIIDKQEAGTAVILIGDKHKYLIAGVYASVMSGHPYVIISSDTSAQRMKEISESCNAKAILDFAGKRDYENPQFFYSRDQIHEICNMEIFSGWKDKVYAWRAEEILAYYFTSGSTGTPKGVKITFGNICSMLRNRRFMNEKFLGYQEDEQPVVLDFVPYSFVASLPTIFGDILTYGAELCPVTPELLRDYRKLINYILEKRPTHFTATPSFINICLKDERFCKEFLPELRVLYSGGASLNLNTVREFRRRFDAELVSGYGASETTSAVMYMVASEIPEEETGFMPAGRTLPEAKAMIQDEKGGIAEDGEIGELCIVSSSVCGGYTSGEETSFFYDNYGKKGYRTGDLFRKKGETFYYVGRRDQMVKVGGRRIEIFEVEKRLMELDEVNDAAVVPCRDNGEICFLVAFVELDKNVERGITTTLKIKGKLKKTLSTYAIPQVILYPGAIPKSKNQKPDRKLMEEKAYDATIGRNAF